MAGGRPTKYKQSTAKAICLRLMCGESLKSICRRKLYPSHVTVLSWTMRHPQFLNQYVQARELQQELLYDELFEIADDSSLDYSESKDGIRLNSEHVTRSRLRIDTRKWVMERMAAKKYGAKQSIDHQSSDGSMTPKAFSKADYDAASQTLAKDMDGLD